MRSIVSLDTLQPTHAPQLFKLVDRNRPELSKFWWERLTYSAVDSAIFIATVNRLERENGAPTRGIFIGSRLIGVAALHTIDWQLRTSLLGFWLDKAESGKGYGTEVVRGLADLAFTELDLNELRIATRETNGPTRAIAQKLGFQLLHIQDEPLWQTEEVLVPTATYALDAADYTIAQNLHSVTSSHEEQG